MTNNIDKTKEDAITQINNILQTVNNDILRELDKISNNIKEIGKNVGLAFLYFDSLVINGSNDNFGLLKKYFCDSRLNYFLYDIYVLLHQAVLHRVLSKLKTLASLFVCVSVLLFVRARLC